MGSGRNDLCRCGSNRKYKKCCMAADEAGRAQMQTYEAHLRMRNGLTQKMLDLVAQENLAEPSHIMSSLSESPFFDNKIRKWLRDTEEGKDSLKSMVIPALLCAYPLAGGRFLWQYCLLKYAKRFTAAEMEFIKNFEKSITGFFQVKNIASAEAMTELEDITTRKTYTVMDKGLSESIVRHDIIAGHLVPFSGKLYCLEGMAQTVIPPSYKDEISGLLSAYAKLILNIKRFDMERDASLLLRQEPMLVYDVVLRICYEIYNKPLPVIRNTSGEKLMLCTRRYRHTGREETKKFLQKLAGLELDEEGDENDRFVWLDEKRTMLGSISLTQAEVFFEANSKNRAARWEKKIKKASWTLLESSEKGLGELRDSEDKVAAEKKPLPKISEDEYRQIAEEYFLKYYDDWISHPVPALNNQTPLAAVKTQSGRKAVADLLDEFENHNDRMCQEAPEENNLMKYCDINEIRRRLGLKTSR